MRDERKSVKIINNKRLTLRYHSRVKKNLLFEYILRLKFILN